MIELIDWSILKELWKLIKEWEEYKEYLVEESKCGEYKDGDSFEIYNEDDEESGDGMVELKIKGKDLY